MSNFEQQLEKKIHQLPEQKMPEKDLWRGIELSLDSQPWNGNNRVDNQRKYLAPQWLSLAASVCVICALWFLVPSFNNSAEPSLQGEQLVNALSQQQADQINALLVTYKNAAVLTDDWQMQLQELDDAASAIKLALQHDPNNGALIRMLHHVYQQQIALIERVHAPKWQSI